MAADKVKELEKGNKGLRTYRFEKNPHERAATELWDIHNNQSNLLSYILGDGQRHGIVSERDELVAATLMQWLGSPVGRNFLRDLNAKFEEVSKKLEGEEE